MSSNIFSCDKCNKTFIYKHHLTRHQNGKKYPCQDTPHNSSQLLTNSSQIPQNSSQTPHKLLKTPQNSSQIPHKLLKTPHKSSQIPHNSSQLLTNSSQIPHNSSQNNKTISDEDNLKTDKKREHLCTGCGKIFSRTDNLKRHIIQFCKGKIIKKQDEEVNILNEDNNQDDEKSELNISDEYIEIKPKEETRIVKKYSTDLENYLKTHELDEKTQSVLDILVRQNEKLLSELSVIKHDNSSLKDEIKKLKQNTTINNTLNNQNNIILAHGKEEFDKIDLEVIMKHLSTVDFRNIIPNMTKHLYLNDSNPQFKNFCVVDISRNKAKFYDGKKWIIGKADAKIDKIFDKVQNILTEPFEGDKLEKTIQFIKDNPKKFNRKWIDYSKRYLDNLYDEEDKDSIENKRIIIDELKHIFFNNKDDILKISLENTNTKN